MIRLLREEQNLSQEALAERAGISTSQVSRYESGKASLLHPGAERLAHALGLSSAASLISQETYQVDVEIIGLVGAGAEVFPLDDLGESVASPPGMYKPIAVRVKGNSMVPAYYEGDVIIADQEHLPENDILGRDCIVQVSDGPRLVKRVLRGGARGTFRLLSYQTQEVSEDKQLDWAAPVRWVRR